MTEENAEYRDSRNVTAKVIKVEENDRVIWEDGERLPDGVRVIKLSLTLGDNVDRAARLGKLEGSVEHNWDHGKVDATCGDYPGNHPWKCDKCENWFGCLEPHSVCLGDLRG